MWRVFLETTFCEHRTKNDTIEVDDGTGLQTTSMGPSLISNLCSVRWVGEGRRYLDK